MQLPEVIMQLPEVIMQVRKRKCRSSEAIMQVPGSYNAGPGRDILGLEMMSEGIETLLEKKKANGIIFGSSFILSEIFIS